MRLRHTPSRERLVPALLFIAPGLLAGAVALAVGRPLLLDAPEPKRLTDREAWLELAALVPQAFADQPEAVRTALVQAFRQQAA